MLSYVLTKTSAALFWKIHEFGLYFVFFESERARTQMNTDGYNKNDPKIGFMSEKFIQIFSIEISLLEIEWSTF